MSTLRKCMVVRYNSTDPQHSWKNGLYVVLRSFIRNGVVWISKLKEDQLNISSTGVYDYSIDSIADPDISITRLSYKVDTAHLPKYP